MALAEVTLCSWKLFLKGADSWRLVQEFPEAGATHPSLRVHGAIRPPLSTLGSSDSLLQSHSGAAPIESCGLSSRGKLKGGCQ